DAAAEVEEVAGAAVLLGDPLDLLFALDGLGHLRRELGQVGHQAPPLLGIDPTALATEVECQEIERRQRRRERLGGRTADRRPGGGVELHVAAAGDRGVDYVAYR